MDTSEDLARALTHAVALYDLDGGGRGPFGPEDVKPMVGEGLERLIAKSLGPEAIESDLQLGIERFVRYYNDHLVDNTLPYEGVADTLRKLYDSGYLMAVLSNKRTAMCDKILKALGLQGYFKVVAGGDAPPENKPSPKAAQYVLDALGADAADSVMVGDSDVDIMTARASGMRSIAVTYGFRPPESLREADHLVDSFSRVLDALRSMGVDVPR